MLTPIQTGVRRNVTSTALNKDMLGFATVKGDFLVYAAYGSDVGILPQAPSSTGGLVWTQRMSSMGWTGYGSLGMWTAPVPANMTIDCYFRATWSGAGGNSWGWNMNILQNVAAYRDFWQTRGSGAPVFNTITQWEHNSAFVYTANDWNVRTPTGSVISNGTGGTIGYSWAAGDAQQTHYNLFVNSLGEPGALGSLGISSPNTQKYTMGAIELYGPLNPKAYQKNSDGSLTLVDTPNYWNGSTLTPVTYEFT